MALIFRPVTIKDAQLTLDWRHDLRVKKQLKTDFEPDLANQKAWIEASNLNNEFGHWILNSDEHPFAYFMIIKRSIKKKSIHFGYWVGDETRLGYGALSAAAFYNFIFNNTIVESIYAEVLGANEKAISMHTSMGYIVDKVTPNISTHYYDSITEYSLVLHKPKWFLPNNQLANVKCLFEDTGALDKMSLLN